MTPTTPPDEFEPPPVTPVFPPLEDGDRDTENPDSEVPTLVQQPGWLPANWHNELIAYHSHLCECHLCTEAENRRKVRLSKFFEDTLKW